MNAVTHTTPDSAKESTVLNAKSELQFLPYKGKIIRHIFIQTYGFERNFADTSKPIDYYGTRLLNRLHKDTREWVVRNNLFIKEATEVDPYYMADNERHLRSLDYIQDARIIVKPITGNKDSVDIYVITKDLFSLTGELNDLSTTKFKCKVADANVAGMGQRVQLTTLWEKDRTPGFGYELLYSKNNIANTFVNATAVYSTIKPDLTYGMEAEKAWLISFERPLFSQYSHMAGAVTVSHNQSENRYTKPDSVYYNYHYNSYDAWLGYNLGIKTFPKNKAYKNRFFLSTRYFNYRFQERPLQITTPFDFRYDNRKAILAQFTFFRQNFYKTNYIFGFGTTEDIPYGYNISFTTGWYKQNYMSRPYLGIDANKYIANDRGFFIQYFLRTGGFLNRGQIQDAAALAGGSLFSPLFIYRNIKIRQYIRLSYTKEFNRVGLDPLKINNSFGLRYFGSDSAIGDQRISFHSETFFFLNYKLFGFKFAPFAFADVTALTPEKENFAKTGFYYGLGGGVRIRNENLVFNTIEFRCAYFPRKINEEAFKITIAANIRFRYSSNYVKAPDIIQLNNDDINNIF
ncbi:hypothetical protein FRZ67_03090 [Panacibacter ginsenosidivorans]|uniref:BamA/TamA family outer membrane protein n=1 Tax=Panacibacter ginsenosidivorans TaxID=1813871 RepID=A0A5B8VEX0_9BACT|nr:hypothetical protein FRZ67_03090 [Panacibacter ginsenosidivorans]